MFAVDPGGETGSNLRVMTQPTINDVARIAGVSKKTVSRVINRSPLLSDATRAKVEAVIAEIGYVPNPQARALALRRNFLVALVHDGSDPQIALAAQEGMLTALAGSEYALVVRPIEQGAGATGALRVFLEQHRPAGVLLLPPLAEDAALADVCRQIGVQLISIVPASRDRTDALAANEREAVAGVVGYLIALGHRRIGIIAGPDDDGAAQERELGYLDAMADHDLDRGPALIASGDFSFESGRAAGKLLLEVSPRPTAIFAANDAMAAGVLHAAREQGLAVPAELSIVGFGDTPLAAQLWPPLTTVRLPVRDMAEAAARRLIAGADSQAPEIFTADFVPRASAAPAPA